MGLPHERFFTIACHVSSYSETGQFFIHTAHWMLETKHNYSIYYSLGRGKSKKEAKRLAAHQMWQILQDMPVDSQDDGADEVRIYCHIYYYK